MATTIRVINGKYRSNKIENTVFTLSRPLDTFEPGKIQVRNEGQIPGAGRNVFITVPSSKDFEVIVSNSRTKAIEFTAAPAKTVDVQDTETDDQAMDRIATRFAILDEMTKAAINSDIRAMIVSGPPGVGKSFGVETQLEKATLFDKLSNKKIRFEIVKGALTALGLYAQLYKFSDAKNVLVFDDADGIFSDELALNILKAALDSGKRRKIFWNSDSAMLRREGIPDSFEFKGSVIFITNLNFANTKSKKIADHLTALQSRCHYLDLTINSERDKILRIKQVHRDASNDHVGGLFAEYEFPQETNDEILEFMWTNKNRLREISLRMALKIADLVKISPTNWKMLAENTVMFNS